MPRGWEGNRRSGHASRTQVVYPPTGSTANVWEMSTLPMLLMGHRLVCLLFMPVILQKQRFLSYSVMSSQRAMTIASPSSSVFTFQLHRYICVCAACSVRRVREVLHVLVFCYGTSAFCDMILCCIEVLHMVVRLAVLVC